MTRQKGKKKKERNSYHLYSYTCAVKHLSFINSLTHSFIHVWLVITMSATVLDACVIVVKTSETVISF